MRGAGGMKNTPKSDTPVKSAIGIEIPKFLSRLKTYGGYPVPFVQLWIDGKPDFRVIDPEKVARCVNEKLYAICGVRLGEFCYFIGGDLCKQNHLFTDRRCTSLRVLVGQET
jgi:hypothetical protein